MRTNTDHIISPARHTKRQAYGNWGNGFTTKRRVHVSPSSDICAIISGGISASEIDNRFRQVNEVTTNGRDPPAGKRSASVGRENRDPVDTKHRLGLAIPPGRSRLDSSTESIGHAQANRTVLGRPPSGRIRNTSDIRGVGPPADRRLSRPSVDIPSLRDIPRAQSSTRYVRPSPGVSTPVRRHNRSRSRDDTLSSALRSPSPANISRNHHQQSPTGAPHSKLSLSEDDVGMIDDTLDRLRATTEDHLTSTLSASLGTVTVQCSLNDVLSSLVSSEAWDDQMNALKVLDSVLDSVFRSSHVPRTEVWPKSTSASVVSQFAELVNSPRSHLSRRALLVLFKLLVVRGDCINYSLSNSDTLLSICIKKAQDHVHPIFITQAARLACWGNGTSIR
eukprot:GHVH01004905.1.p1 GENE.GHVH01004905.1~~GHVH01004905.1.p1  ORF type:complete len:424 (-),score=28.85 GHVH01004905.1:34-1209(-)